MKHRPIQDGTERMSDKESTLTQPLAAPLTRHERAIMALVGHRRTNRQIAAELVLAHSTGGGRILKSRPEI